MAEPVLAQLALAVCEHRHPIAIALLKVGVDVHIDDRNLKMKTALQ